MATGQDPGSFKVAQKLLLVLGAGQAASIVTAVLGILGVPVLFFALMTDVKEKTVNWKIIPRLIGYVVVMVSAYNSASEEGPFVAIQRSVAAQAAYRLDMHEDRTCSSVDGDRVVRINDDLVIVARPTDEAIVFRRIACKLAAQDEPLPPPRKPKSESVSKP